MKYFISSNICLQNYKILLLSIMKKIKMLAIVRRIGRAIEKKESEFKD